MSYNVFADMGLPDPETELLKAHLVLSLNEIIAEKGVSLEDVSHQLKVAPEAFADMLEGGWDDFTTTDLFRFVNALNRNVRIIIDSRDVAPNEEARTLVLTA